MSTTAEPDFRAAPTSPGTERSDPRRPDADTGAEAPAPAAGLGGLSWPRRATCNRFLISHDDTGMLLTGCILPPAHRDSHLPPPLPGPRGEAL